MADSCSKYLYDIILIDNIFSLLSDRAVETKAKLPLNNYAGIRKVGDTDVWCSMHRYRDTPVNISYLCLSVSTAAILHHQPVLWCYETAAAESPPWCSVHIMDIRTHKYWQLMDGTLHMWSQSLIFFCQFITIGAGVSLDYKSKLETGTEFTSK